MTSCCDRGRKITSPLRPDSSPCRHICPNSAGKSVSLSIRIMDTHPRMLERIVCVIDDARVTNPAWTLAGKTALVTGGTRGIGRAIAADVTTADGRARIVAAVTGPLHVLVHNAGSNIRSPLVGYDDATIEKLIALNLTAPLLLSRDLHPRLREANGASVVHVGSVAGHVALPTGVAYAAAKAGLAQAARTLALEWARDGIRVNSVAPW